jgi:hypothetical protein
MIPGDDLVVRNSARGRPCQCTRHGGHSPQLQPGQSLTSMAHHALTSKCRRRPYRLRAAETDKANNYGHCGAILELAISAQAAGAHHPGQSSEGCARAGPRSVRTRLDAPGPRRARAVTAGMPKSQVHHISIGTSWNGAARRRGRTPHDPGMAGSLSIRSLKYPKPLNGATL